ncbi:hypothetical protein ACIOEX_30925, partial [Streptomyces sp. NPDC087850]
MAEHRFTPGDVIVRREMLDEREWMVYPVRVVAHDDTALAVYAAQGTPLTFGTGEFARGPHPGRGSVRPGSRKGFSNSSAPVRDTRSGPGCGMVVSAAGTSTSSVRCGVRSG